MKVTQTLSRYLALRYVFNALFLFVALLSIIYLFDTLELIRRAGKRDDVPLSLVLQMGLLKLPEVGQLLMPFAVLFSAMFTFWQLTRRNELIVARAAGFSIWQFLTPVCGVAFVAGLLLVTVFNPIGTLLLGRFEQLESEHLNLESNQIAVFKGGLWLRQNGQDPGDYLILRASRVVQSDWTMSDVSVYYFDDANRFERRVDAQSAHLLAGKWRLDDAVIYAPSTGVKKAKAWEIPTNLSVRDVEDSFSSVETVSFWKLPSHIQTLEETGFDATRLRVHYHSLLSQPFLFVAMVLIAAAVSMRPPRMNGGLAVIVSGVFVGFVVFFLSSFLQALGASQQLPSVMAAWSPAVIALLLGVSIMMRLEDG